MTPQPDRDDKTLGISRRALLAGAGLGVAAASLGWIPGERIPAARAQTSTPVNFPSGIDLYQQSFVNWAQQIDIPNVWYCAPSSPAEVVTLANWAYQNGYRLRAVGEGHNWSPLVLAPGESVSKIVLVNLQDSLTSISIDTSGSPVTVTVQAGATMNALLTALQADGYGFTTVPAPGDLTIGGVLAIDGHGSAIRATGETPVAGNTYGSLSNAIQSLTIVGWNGSAYALQTFSRTDPAIAPFLTHLGRTIVTEVTLEVGANQNLQCQSLTSIPVSTLFAAPASAGSDSYASLVAASGRVEAIWFPFTTNPWVKIWSRQPDPALRHEGGDRALQLHVRERHHHRGVGLHLRHRRRPDLRHPRLRDAARVRSWRWASPASGTANLWGPSMDVLLYVQPTTLRVTAGGWTILTSRASIQQVVYDFYTHYNGLLNSFQADLEWPMNGPVEIRVTGLDQPSEAGLSGAVTPLLSAATPRPDQPSWDVAVWVDMLTVPGTSSSLAFYEQMEQWLFSHYTGSYASVRPEWSKGWAFSSSGAWTNTTMLTSTIPAAINAGQPQDNFQVASAAFDAFDPHRIFGNTFLDTLLP